MSIELIWWFPARSTEAFLDEENSCFSLRCKYCGITHTLRLTPVLHHKFNIYKQYNN